MGRAFLPAFLVCFGFACSSSDPPDDGVRDAGGAVDGGPVRDGGPFPVPEAVLISAEELALIPGVPRDADGNVVLFEIDGVPLALGPPRADAIGAAATCIDLVTACVIHRRDLDACVTSLPVCATERPWEESTKCCSSACVAAYQEERRLGAAPHEADRAVFGSDHECFPGRQELLRQAGATPYLAPRRAP